MATDTAEDLAALADELALGEHDIRQVLETVGANGALRAFRQHCEVRFAVRLLRQGVGTDAIRDALMAQYLISERSAYYRVADALRSLQESATACSETPTD